MDGGFLTTEEGKGGGACEVENAKDDVKATGISRLRASNTAEYMRSIGLKGDVYTSGQGRSKVSGENGRKVVVTLNYKVMRSTDFEVGELKQMLLG